MENSTRCRRLTGPGRSAIAVIAIDGPEAAKVIHQCARFSTRGDVAVGQIRFANWCGPRSSESTDRTRRNDSITLSENDASSDPKRLDGLAAAGESVVITALSRDHWEVHCHGGVAAVERLMEDLRTCGVEQVEHSESGQAKIIQEAESVLGRCLTERTAAIALEQVRGGLRIWAQNWLSKALEVDPPAGIREEAETILRSADWTTRMTEPWKIVLLGAPNVGKSSLLNAIVGFDRSITYNQAGTTRDVLHASTVIAGVSVRLSDTAGIRESGDPLEAEGMKRAINAAESADLVIDVYEPSQLPLEPRPIHADTLADFSDPHRIKLLNKIDLLPSSERNGSTVADFAGMTSTVTGEGIEPLLEELGTRLNDGAPDLGSPVVLTERQRDLVQQIAAASPERPIATTLQQLIGDPE